MFSKPSRNGSKKRRSHTARIAGIVGGGLQGALSQKEVLNADMIFVADVAEEIEQLELNDREVVEITLAQGETLGTLTNKLCPPKFKEHLRELPGVGLSAGLVQSRPVGGIAATLLVRDPRFQSRLNTEIYTPLQRKFDGSLPSIEVAMLIGMNGATGAGGGIPFGKALTETILQQSSSAVTLRFVGTGSLHNSLFGDKVHRNCAATLAELLDFLLDPNRDPRESRTADIAELPMLGADKGERDEFIRFYVRAIQSPEVQEILRRGFPNECFESRFGGIRLLRASYFKPIPSYAVAAEVARQTIGEGERLLQVGAAAGIGDEIAIGLREEPVELATPQMIAEMLKRSKVIPTGLEAICVASPTRFVVESVQIGVPDEEPMSLGGFLTSNCQTAKEVSQKLGLSIGLNFQIDRHLKEKTRLLQRATADFQGAKKEFQSRVARLFPSLWWQKAAAAVADRAGAIIGVQNAIQLVRHRLETLDRLTAEVNALSDASAMVSTEIAHEQERVRRVCSLLASVADSAPPEPRVRAGNIDQFLARLMEQISGEPSGITDDIVRTLSQGAEEVTMAGLAEIFGVKEVRPEKIAEAIVRCEPVTVGPPWGGHPQTGKRKRIMKLPPMQEEGKGWIRRLVAQLDKDLIVAFADSAKGSINAVYLEVYCPKTADEILTPFHIQHLRKACETPELYFSAGKTGSHWLPENRNEGSTPCEA